MGRILLCAPCEAFAHPGVLGLPDVDLESVDWLVLESDEQAARAAASAQEEIGEAWVAGSDGMEAVNIAAALRADDAQMPVYVVSSDVSGSLCSRARAAGLSGVLTLEGLSRRFSDERGKRRRLADALAGLEADLEASLAEQAGAERQPSGPVAPTSAAPSPADERGARGYVLTVLSGSGGAGKSTVAAVAAHAAAAKGHRVLLFDADLQFGDLACLTGDSTAPTADDAVGDARVVADLAARVEGGGVALLAAPQRLEQAEVVAAHAASLIDAAASLFDVVVVNTGASWAECHAALIERSDRALFLIDQRASSVRACRHAVELCARLGIATGTFSYAVNRCKRGALFTSLDVACALQGAHVHELKDGGSDVEELLGAGDARELLRSKNALCSSVSEMLDELLPQSLAGAASPARSKRKAKAAPAAGRASRKRGRKGLADAALAACGMHVAEARS